MKQKRSCSSREGQGDSRQVTTAGDKRDLHGELDARLALDESLRPGARRAARRARRADRRRGPIVPRDYRRRVRWGQSISPFFCRTKPVATLAHRYSRKVGQHGVFLKRALFARRRWTVRVCVRVCAHLRHGAMQSIKWFKSRYLERPFGLRLFRGAIQIVHSGRRPERKSRQHGRRVSASPVLYRTCATEYVGDLGQTTRAWGLPLRVRKTRRRNATHPGGARGARRGRGRPAAVRSEDSADDAASPRRP
jgi:hypothetical protein